MRAQLGSLTNGLGANPPRGRHGVKCSASTQEVGDEHDSRRNRPLELVPKDDWGRPCSRPGLADVSSLHD